MLCMKDGPLKMNVISSMPSVAYFTNKIAVEVDLLIEKDEATFVI